MNKKSLNGYFAVQNMIFTMLIVVFFLCGIIYYYTMLYTETKEHITKIGELNAATSAEQIDKYFSSGVDTLKLASYTLDNMIRNGNSQKEILEYLQNQSSAISNITNGYSTSFYGYINNTYLDGNGWIPDSDYIPIERPWYVDAEANIGRVAIVGPYIDSETHNSIITLSKTLCDVKSVVAMDFSMDRLQAITEELTAQGESYAEIILNHDYQVIAHSDKSEISKCYFTEQGTLGNALVEKLRTTDEDFFFLEYADADYIVYTTTVANDWFCLSVIDATSSLSQLKKPLVFMVASALSIIVIQLIILIRANRNTQITQQLSENLSQAKNTISEKENQIGEISQLAFRDALTSVGSKAAFNQLSEELSEKRKAEQISVAVVMMDVNNLKYVNDTFGHEAGDKYLCGCCDIICKIFQHSPVFRTGGDEFIAILQNDDYDNRTALLQKLNAACDTAYAQENKAPWERYTIAAGLADWFPEEPTLEQALSRADKAMYEAKRLFKQKHKNNQ